MVVRMYSMSYEVVGVQYTWRVCEMCVRYTHTHKRRISRSNSTRHIRGTMPSCVIHWTEQPVDLSMYAIQHLHILGNRSFSHTTKEFAAVFSPIDDWERKRDSKWTIFLCKMNISTNDYNVVQSIFERSFRRNVFNDILVEFEQNRVL